jgi:type IV pilus assembly protein PilY1
MKNPSLVRHPLLAAVTAAALLASMLGRAALTDIAQAPLGTAPTVTVLPNLMYILDDSGSMALHHMPDEVADSTSCKSCSSSSCNVGNTACAAGHPPYYAFAFNTIYYNPQITYAPGVNSLGASLGNASPTAAPNDPYIAGSGTRNLVTTWTEIYWCDTSTPTTAELADSTKCKRNGIHTPVPFAYTATSASNSAPFAGGFPTTGFRHAITVNSNPHYYEITPREHCTDETLTVCVASTTPTVTHPVPALVRWCRSNSSATSGTLGSGSPAPVSGGSPPFCQSKNDGTTYLHPRLGNLTRVDIVPSVATYGNRPNRTDCAARPVCTYAEELQNFANWYTYYRTRMLMMKTVSGRVFAGLDDRYRIGFVTINASSSARYLKIDKFTPTHKAAWFARFYAMTPSGSTPLRLALSRVGRHFAGRTDGINAFMPDDPIQYSCQQNFALLTTDGYWNSSGGVRLDGTTPIGDQDNVEDGKFVTRASGTFDGNLGGTASPTSTGSSDTLADVAMYYYKTDLRPTMKDNVPTSEKNKASHQHMVTFTLGLGLDGLMTYRPDYETATAGDFYKIKTGSSGCPWTKGTCNWPQARGDTPSALDDLWHAAVNGRGIYFSAKDPISLQTGLTNTLASINMVSGAAASSATSTPNITPTDNFIYSSTYRTVKWDGEVVAERIDVTSGQVAPGIVWSARAQLDARVGDTSDTRTIYTLGTTAGSPLVPATPTKLKPFNYSDLTTAEKAFFDNKCIPAELPQCGPMSGGDLKKANDGNNLVKYLRGQRRHEGELYRDRDHVLGDTVNAKPVFVGKPNLLYGDAVSPDYASFKAGPASGRQPVLYIAANDGMLHAFNANTGAELWAYVPRQVMPNLYRLAASNYDINHRYYVDGSPSVMDVFIGGAWRTILVGGLNAGGRGYYALDITDPLDPRGLWEICADSTLCAISDPDMGLSYGNPIITKRPSDGRWVVLVTSGYNNVSPGNGRGYLYVLDAATGAILNKVSTGFGDTTTPSGLAKIAGFATNFAVDNTTTVVYGGDLLGNMFRFDMTTVPPTVQRIAQLRDGTGRIQSVTTKPEVTRFTTPGTFNVIYVGTGRMLGSTDLPDPATLTPPEPGRAYQQTVYAFKDPVNSDLGNLRNANLVQQVLTVVDASTRGVSNNPVNWASHNGWYVDLNPANDSPGERVNIDPQLVRGVLIVATNEPNSEPCSAGGDSFVYQFDYQSGSYVASSPGGVVGTRYGAALLAGFVVYRLPSGQLKYTGIDVTGAKKTEGINPGSGSALGKRVSWRELIL